MTERIDMDSVRLPTMQDVFSIAGTIGDKILEMKDSVSNDLGKVLSKQGKYMPNYFKSDRQKRREKSREFFNRLYSSCGDNIPRRNATQNTKIQQEKEKEDDTIPIVNETFDIAESPYENSMHGGIVADWISQMPKDTAQGKIPKSASAFADLNRSTRRETAKPRFLKKRAISNVEPRSVERMLEISNLDEQYLNQDTDDKDDVGDVIAALKDLRHFDVSILLEDLSREKRRKEHLNAWLSGTVNTIPDSEQQFKRTPHVRRRLSTISMNDSQAAQYVRFKVCENNDCTIQDDKTTKVGTINMKIQFLIVTEKLKVTIENINDIKEDLQLTKDSFVEVCVLPKGERPCKRTCISRGKRNVNFSQDMYIKDITLEDVHMQSLRICWYQSKTTFTKKKLLGETYVCLDNKDVVGCVSLSEDLNLY